MDIKYGVIVSEIAKRGIKKTVIAKALNVSTKAFNNKITGKSKFTWNEVCILQNNFFPDITKDKLMEESA